MRRSSRAIALCALGLALLVPVSTGAKPTIWDRVKQPSLARAEQLFALAERSRVPAEDSLEDLSMFLPSGTSEELSRQLNARAAALISIADGHELGDVRLLYLLGDALVKADKSHLPEGRLRLRQALELAPDSPLAAEAWFLLGVAEGKLRNHAAEREAFSAALAHEWDPEMRASIISNRAESTMASGRLALAIQDYRLALSESRSALTQALALWGLAVATERDGDLPRALELARRASSFRFGPQSHVVVAIDLPAVYFTPEYEKNYYRALAVMAEADVEKDRDHARVLLQTASRLWSLYLDNAERDGERWVDHARAARDACRSKLTKLDRERPENVRRSESGRDED